MADEKDNEKFVWRYFFRQMLVASGTWNIFFSMGVLYGSPTVYIPQLNRSANTTGVYVSDDMASWLSSTVCYAAIPWIFVLIYLARKIGRRKTTLIISLNNIAGFIMFTFSTSTTHLLITKVLFGASQAAAVSITIVVLTEYTSPKYRGMFLTIKSATLFWGIWVANAIGTFFHWWYITLCGLIVSFYALTIFFWPESPHWLASEKRFTECRRAHRWLKGTGEISERELENLIKSQLNYERENDSFWERLRMKELYMPLILSVLVLCQYHLSGKFVITIYAIDIIKRMISDEAKVYRAMLILDGITVFATYMGCYITKICKRRTVLFVFTSAAIAFLFALSIYMYLIKYYLVNENVYVSICFLCGFSLSIGCGPMILSTSLYGELLPARFKSVTFTLVALFSNIMHGILLKVSPLIFKAFGIEGTFLYNAIGSSLSLFLLFLYLPETKDKTLLEIEEYFKSGRDKGEGKKLVAK